MIDGNPPVFRLYGHDTDQAGIAHLSGPNRSRMKSYEMKPQFGCLNELVENYLRARRLVRTLLTNFPVSPGRGGVSIAPDLVAN